ncbi:hypothetical protein [Clostridium sp.]|uniref:hypothetical protein n=1 Tax=Clostridium sp. TaxID=1506 RepID=UPI003D6D3B54
MQFATETYFIEEIDDALTNAWITAQEHADTLALKGENDPQHLPPIYFLFCLLSTV